MRTRPATSRLATNAARAAALLLALPAAALLPLAFPGRSALAQGGQSQTPGTPGTAGPTTSKAPMPMDEAGRKQWYNDMYKKSLDASDDEWKIIQPRLEAVQAAQSAIWGFTVPAAPAPGKDAPRPDPAAPRTPAFEYNDIGKALADLRETLADKNASADLIKTKIDALHKAKEKALADKKAAQQKLREVLSVRQEAVFVTQSVLD